MKTKLIINETQLKSLSNFILEDTNHCNVVKSIEKDLKGNYRKAIETYRDGNDYNQRKCFEIIFDGQLISPDKLLEYFKLKYIYGEIFLKQIINDWCDGKINNGILSKNVGLYE